MADADNEPIHGKKEYPVTHEARTAPEIETQARVRFEPPF